MEEKNEEINYLADRLNRLIEYITSYPSEFKGSNAVEMAKKISPYLENGVIPPVLALAEEKFKHSLDKPFDKIKREQDTNIRLNYNNNADLRSDIILGWFFSKDKLPLVESDKDTEEEYRKVASYFDYVSALVAIAPNIYYLYKQNLDTILAVMSKEEKLAIEEVVKKWVLLKYNHFKYIANQISQQTMDSIEINQKLENYYREYATLDIDSKVENDFSILGRAKFIYQTLVGGDLLETDPFRDLTSKVWPNLFKFCCEFARLEQAALERGLEHSECYGLEPKKRVK